MARTARSKMLRSTGKRHVVPKETFKPEEPINDGPEKWGAGVGPVSYPWKNGEKEFVISPFRMMLPYRPKGNEHIPTERSRQAVMYAAGLGLSQRSIANLLNVSIETLHNHYEEELAISRDLMMNDIQTNLYNIARDPTHKNTVQAGMFLLSRLGGEEYRERKAVELTGKDGKPIEVDQSTRTIDPTLLNADQRDALREILTSALKLANTSNDGAKVIDGDYSVEN